MKTKSGNYPSRDDKRYKQLAKQLQGSDCDWINTGGLIALKCYDEGELNEIVIGRIVFETTV